MFVHAVLLLMSLGASASDGPKDMSLVLLDGVEQQVHWDDGDTFKVLEPPFTARLMGYNALESYGPVHRFGPGEQVLFQLSKKATDLARSKTWECTTKPGDGGYGRRPVDCPKLRKQLLEAGLAHPFSVDGPAPAGDLASQAVAIKAKLGMWSAGPVQSIITSLHSMSENDGDSTKPTYNRILNVKTGEASPKYHSETYSTCSWVCQGDSCMLYVPYKLRYGADAADCLRPKL